MDYIKCSRYSDYRKALSEVKTIQIKTETKRRLDKLGRKGETYDAIIRKLINSYQKNRIPNSAIIAPLRGRFR